MLWTHGTNPFVYRVRGIHAGGKTLCRRFPFSCAITGLSQPKASKRPFTVRLDGAPFFPVALTKICCAGEPRAGHRRSQSTPLLVATHGI